MTKKMRILKRYESGKLTPMPIKKNFFPGTGRRKTAVARAFLYEGKGDIIINSLPVEEYFPGEKAKFDVMKPFHIIGVSHPDAHFNATIKVHGSGKQSQLGAVVHAISWSLATINEEYAEALRKQGMLTRDNRMVERKKPYLRKARKAPQYSKR